MYTVYIYVYVYIYISGIIGKEQFGVYDDVYFVYRTHTYIYIY